MKFLVWNSRGERKAPLLRCLWWLIKKEDTEFIALTETRLSSDSSYSFLLQFTPTYLGCFVPAQGSSGGLVLLWHHIYGQRYVRSVVPQSLHVCVDVNGCIWGLNIVYASTSYIERRKLWTVLTALCTSTIPQLFIGDFNVTLRLEHKRGGVPWIQTPAMTEIIHFIRQSSLLELNQFGYSYSWSN